MYLIRTANKFAQVVLDFALPPKCLSCRAVVDKHGNICPECWNSMSFIAMHKCHICGLPFQFDMGNKAVCPHCETSKPRFNKAAAFCKYEGTARKLAINLKFGDGQHLAPHLARMMLNPGADFLAKADFITPVPLHYRRRMSRKYNQASLLARNIAKQSNKSYMPFLLKRTRYTKQQTKLQFRDRHSNVEGAFIATKDLHGKTVLLIDDVMTTGATLSSCAKALKDKGAKKVYCLVFARVVPDKP